MIFHIRHLLSRNSLLRPSIEDRAGCNYGKHKPV